MLDEDLTTRVKLGEADAIGQLHQVMQPKLINWLNGKVRDDALAEDIASETFVKLLRKHHTISGNPHQLTSWLYSTSYNIFIDYLRMRKRRVDEVGEINDDTLHVDTVDPSQIVETLGEWEVIYSEFAKLTEKQNQACQLRIAGLSQAEIAIAMNSNEIAINQLLHRAKKNLRYNLGL